MNPDQKLIATIGLGLLALVVFTTYKPYFEAIILGTPQGGSSGSGSSPGNGVGGWLNPLNWGVNIGQNIAHNLSQTRTPSNNGSGGTSNPAQTTVLA